MYNPIVPDKCQDARSPLTQSIYVLSVGKRAVQFLVFFDSLRLSSPTRRKICVHRVVRLGG